ncbi:MAG: hypothetical protein K2Y04_12185 [Caulobacteraceae bacterium]|nr:hypothetical protein [Caulobacteraceae bacterium]
MKSRHVSARIARQLQTAEHAVDKAMIETSALIQAMIEGRSEAGFAAEVGHPALLNMVRGLTQLAEARGAVVEGHGGLAAVAAAHDMSWRLDGPLEDKPRPFVVEMTQAAAA